MEPYQERVLVEKQDLDMKLSKLETFIFRSAGKWFDIPEAERLCMTKQYCHMSDYSNILGERIAAFQTNEHNSPRLNRKKHGKQKWTCERSIRANGPSGYVPQMDSQKHLPIQAASSLGKQFALRQVIILGWDGELTHIVTWGKTAEDCSQAADGGNLLKAKWGWPESNDQPSRVKKLQRALGDMLSRFATVGDDERIRMTAEYIKLLPKGHGGRELSI